MSEHTPSSEHSQGERLHWEQLGGSYEEGWQPPAKQLLSRRELDFVGRHLTDADRAAALDVGIGNGRILEFLLSNTSDTVFYGIDFAQSMVDVCRSRFIDDPRVAELRLCDINRDQVPFDLQFDFISAVRVLKYSPTWADGLATLIGRLTPGGTLVFSMPNRLSINRFSRPYSVPWYTTTPAELQERCRALGAPIVEMSGFPRLPYLAYNRAQGRLLTALQATERALAVVCGPTLFGRELFVAVRKV